MPISFRYALTPWLIVNLGQRLHSFHAWMLMRAIQIVYHAAFLHFRVILYFHWCHYMLTPVGCHCSYAISEYILPSFSSYLLMAFYLILASPFQSCVSPLSPCRRFLHFTLHAWRFHFHGRWHSIRACRYFTFHYLLRYIYDFHIVYAYQVFFSSYFISFSYVTAIAFSHFHLCFFILFCLLMLDCLLRLRHLRFENNTRS